MRADRNPYDSARNDPGRRPNVGPLQFQIISLPIASCHPKEPRSSRAPPSDARLMVTGSLDSRSVCSRDSKDGHSRCSSRGCCHASS